MFEYCLGLGWAATAVGLVHSLTRSNVGTMDGSMLCLGLGCHLADGCISSCSILS
jgi:hypothetical protein